jgi:hypothetical protein
MFYGRPPTLGEPGDTVMVGVGALPPPRVARTMPAASPAPPAMSPILNHLEDHRVFRFPVLFSTASGTRSALDIEMVVSPI